MSHWGLIAYFITELNDDDNDDDDDDDDDFEFCPCLLAWCATRDSWGSWRQGRCLCWWWNTAWYRCPQGVSPWSSCGFHWQTSFMGSSLSSMFLNLFSKRTNFPRCASFLHSFLLFLAGSVLTREEAKSAMGKRIALRFSQFFWGAILSIMPAK